MSDFVRPGREETDAHLAAIVESSEDAIITHTTSGVITSWNPGAERLFGYSAEDALDRSVAMLIPSEQVEEEPKVWAAVMRGESVPHFDTVRLHRSGTAIDVSVTISPIKNAQGFVVGVSKIARDISRARAALRELSRREREFATLVENSPDVVARITPDLRHRYVSPSIERYTGVSPAAMLGKTNAELGMAPELTARWDAAQRRVFDTGQPGTVEFAFTTVTGEVRHFESRLVPEFSIGGEVESVLSVAVDVTERVRAVESLRASDRRKDEFLATLAHELRNPLAPISNALEVIRLSFERELRERARQVVERQLAQLVHLVDDLFDLGRINQGKLKLRTQVLDVRTAIQSAVEAARPSMSRRKHDLRLELDVEPLCVLGDPTRLTQLFANILSNAATYTPDGGHIHLHSSKDESGVLVTVRDDGVGIAPESIDRVFEMFTQLGEARSERQAGLGIGLALARQIVALHGGSIEVKSDGIGSGTTVLVRLPAATHVPTLPVKPLRPPEPSRIGAGLRVLVADDNVDSAESLLALLQLLGCEAAMATDGVEAVQLARSFRPNLALLDLGMPRMDGYEAAQRIRSESADRINLVALSGWDQPWDRDRSAETGFDLHLVKPLEPLVLEKLIGDENMRARSKR